MDTALVQPIDELWAYVFPWIREDEDRPNRCTVFGSGLLLAVGDARLIVTAAHVLDEFGDGTIYLARGMTFEGARCTATSTQVPANGTREDDEIDIAVVRLPVEVGLAMERFGCRFLDPALLAPEIAPTSPARFLFMGYPSRRNQPWSTERIIRPEGVAARCLRVPHEDVGDLGWHPDLHVLGRFRRDYMADHSGARMTAPLPHGMSGGPVWVQRPGSNEFVVAGIGIEYNRHRHLLVGTHVGAVSYLIRQAFPDLYGLI